MKWKCKNAACAVRLRGGCGAAAAQVLERLLGEPGVGDGSGSGSTHFGYDVLPRALRDGLRVCAHHHPGYWRVRTNSIGVFTPQNPSPARGPPRGPALAGCPARLGLLRLHAKRVAVYRLV
jgi:hypothetical protein